MLALASLAQRRHAAQRAIFVIGLALPLAAVARRSTPLPPEESAALAAVVTRLAEAGPDGVPPLVMEALGAVDLGHDDKCRRAIGNAAKGAGEVRAMAALNILESCKFPLWEPFGRAANQRGGLAADPLFVAACDEKGRDSIFTGALSSLRAEMEPGHYAAFRQLLPELRDRLKEDGTPAAREAWKAIEGALPRLAAQLVALDREAHPVPAAGDPPPFDRRDDGRGERQRAAAPLLSVDRRSISLDGSDVVRVDAVLGRKDADGWTLPALGKRLDRWRHDFAERHPAAPPRDRIVLRPDPDVRFEILARLVHAAEVAGFPVIDFAVPLRDRAYHRVRWSGHSAAPLVLALAPPPDRVEFPDEPKGRGKGEPTPAPAPASRPASSADREAELVIEAAGFVARSHAGAEQRVPDVDGKPDEAQVRKGLGWLRKGHGAVLAVTVADDVRYQRLLWALDLARDVGFTRPRIDVEPPAGAAGASAGSTAAPTGSPTADVVPPPGSEKPADLGDLGSLGVVDSGPAVTVEIEPARVEGGLPDDAVAKVLKGHLPEVRGCYAAEVSKRASLSGHLVLQLLVGGGGAVSKAFVSSSTLRNPAVEQCLSRAAQRWTFPMPDGGVAVIVTAPYALRPGRK